MNFGTIQDQIWIQHSVNLMLRDHWSYLLFFFPDSFLSSRVSNSAKQVRTSWRKGWCPVAYRTLVGTPWLASSKAASCCELCRALLARKEIFIFISTNHLMDPLLGAMEHSQFKKADTVALLLHNKYNFEVYPVVAIYSAFIVYF